MLEKQAKAKEMAKEAALFISKFKEVDQVEQKINSIFDDEIKQKEAIADIEEGTFQPKKVKLNCSICKEIEGPKDEEIIKLSVSSIEVYKISKKDIGHISDHVIKQMVKTLLRDKYKVKFNRKYTKYNEYLGEFKGIISLK